MRLARIKVRGRAAVYHLMSRIVGGQHLLDDVCKEQFKDLMWQHAQFCGIDVITYCVMNNHFHILARVPDSPEAPDKVLLQRVAALYSKKSDLFKATDKEFRQRGKILRSRREALLKRMGDVSCFMKELKQHFSRWYNQHHDRYGTLWAERFKSVIVEDQPGVVGVLAAYIDLNPVRAGMVKDPKDYRFCGYTEALAGGSRGEALRKQIRSFSKRRCWKTAAAEYRELMLTKAPVSGHSKKNAMTPEEIRKKLEDGCELSVTEFLRLRVRYFSDGVAIGSARFVNEIFTEFRDRFSANRETGARPLRGIRGPALSFLKSLRDLRLRRFS